MRIFPSVGLSREEFFFIPTFSVRHDQFGVHKCTSLCIAFGTLRLYLVHKKEVTVK